MPYPRPHILFVCHGNVARSPAAELLARNRFPDLGWEFASGGIGALVGQGVADTVAAELRARGVEAGRHRARQLERRMLHRSTLVLTMERSHRSWILDEWPELARRTLLLKQVARLRTKAARRVDPVAHLLGHDHAVDRADDLADPYRRGHEAARIAVAEIEHALDVILPWLGSAPAQAADLPGP